MSPYQLDHVSSRSSNGVRLGTRKYPTGLHAASARDDPDGVRKSLHEAGTMVDYEDEDPQIRKEFEDSLEREGVACRMPAVNDR